MSHFPGHTAMPRVSPSHYGASNGQVAVSALGSGRACPTTVIASVHQALYGAVLSSQVSVRRVISCPIPEPVISRCTSLLGSTGLCVHAGQWSLPPRAALVAGPTRPHQVGHSRVLRFRNPVGTGAVKVRYIQPYNIQGVKQRDPSVLHDTVSLRGGGVYQRVP